VAFKLVSYQDAGEPLPKPGKLLIVTNWIGEAKALIRTHRVMVYRFVDVPATFAELEGDGTLAWWRATHHVFWKRTPTDHVVDDDLRVVCEEFALLPLAYLRFPSTNSESCRTIHLAIVGDDHGAWGRS
jgi:uncharacterized protein YhfF